MRCFAALAFVFLSFQLGTVVARRPILIQRAQPGPTATTTTTSFNPGLDSLTHVDRTPQVKKRYITNAERLASGLPLNPPVRRKKKDKVVARGEHVPRHHEPHHPQPSSSLSKVESGFIQVFDANSGDLTGFVARSFNEFGEYITTTDLGQALAVQIDVGLATSGTTDIASTNGPDINFPFFGAITGFTSDSPNLGQGSPNYVYLGGVIETSQGSTPVQSPNSFSSVTTLNEDTESAIWSIDSDGTLQCHWVNQDSSTPQLLAGITAGALMYTGDPNAFDSRHNSSMQVVTLKFVPTS